MAASVFDYIWFTWRRVNEHQCNRLKGQTSFESVAARLSEQLIVVIAFNSLEPGLKINTTVGIYRRKEIKLIFRIQKSMFASSVQPVLQRGRFFFV